MRTKAVMRISEHNFFFQVAVLCFIFLSAVLSAQQADMSDHQRNVSDCRNGWGYCDRSKLSEAELTALMVAEHQRNVSNCENGFTSCDHSRLTVKEAQRVSAMERDRRVEDCKIAVEPCHDVELTRSETTDVCRNEA